MSTPNDRIGGSGVIRHQRLALAALLSFQTALLAWSAIIHSPTVDEVGHLAAGLHHWQTGSFDLYRVNPPLVRLVATAPLALLGLKVESPDQTQPPSRPEFNLGRRFVDQHGLRAFWYFTIARWACIPFALLLTTVIGLWARELYGPVGGGLAASLWVVCPNTLANGQMITPDTGGAVFAFTATYLFWRWVKKPEWFGTVVSGGVLGLAILCKSTSILLVPTWLTLWCIVRYRLTPQSTDIRSHMVAKSFVIFSIAIYMLNAGYGFEDTGITLGKFQFTSEFLTTTGSHGRPMNRFLNTGIQNLPVPLPRNFVEGIDVQKRDFESGMRSYLRGEWRTSGWWWYYLYGLIVKTPVGTLALFGISILSLALMNRGSCGWRDELFLLFPGCVILGFVSSQTGFNHHLRYVLPALPFFFVWIGRVTAYSGSFQRFWSLGICSCLVASAVSSLMVYPHSLSYFNEPAGGPRCGHDHLVDSNIDWGQDLLILKNWLDRHIEARPFGLAYFGYVDPRTAGIEFTLPPRGPTAPADFLPPRSQTLGPRPGWYGISVTMLRGYHYPLATGTNGFDYIDAEYFAYFRKFQPLTTAGYSIYIYHLTEADCNAVRAELGLPLL